MSDAPARPGPRRSAGSTGLPSSSRRRRPAGAPGRVLGAVLALLGAVAGAGAVKAQDMPHVVSPLKVEGDLNGVNVVTGKLVMDGPVISVPAAPRLRFDRIQNAAPYASGRVFKNSPDSYATMSFSIHAGRGVSDSFKCVEIDCGSVTGSGSVLRVGMAPGLGATYTEAGSGAVFRFTVKHVDTYGSPDRSMLYYVSSVQYPDGETIGYTYDGATLPGDTFGRIFYRPIKVQSSVGYYLTIGYQPGELGEPGWGSVREATLYASADPATPLARLTYGADGSVTDLGGRVYSCCGSTLGADVEVASASLTLPGESVPAFQVTPAGGTIPLVGSVTRDGAVYTYGYTNVRLDRGNVLFDRVTVDGPLGYHQVYAIGQREYHNVLTSVTDPLNRTTDVDSDSAGRTISVIAPERNSAELLYDEWGNITLKTVKPKPGNAGQIQERAVYPGEGCLKVLCYRPTAYIDALTRQTDFAHDSAGRLVEQTDPADSQGVRRKTYIEYDSLPGASGHNKVVRVCGDTTTCGTANEIRTEYDLWGATDLPSAERRIDAARGVTLTTTYSYDPAGRPLVVDGPLPGTDDAAYFRYDLYGRKTWEIGAKGANGFRNARHFLYRDSDDKVAAVEEGILADPDSSALAILTRTDLAYDLHRNVARESAAAGGSVQSVTDKGWDDRGRLLCSAIRMNPAAFAEAPGACAFTTAGSQGPDRITRNVYDAAGQLLTVQRGYGVTLANGFPATLQQDYVRYDYTPNGRQKAVTDANGNRAEMSYDGYDRQKRWIFPSNAPGFANASDYEEYDYDLAGNRTSLRKRDGRTIYYQYDGANRLTLKSVPASASGAAGYTVHYGYDAAGLQTYARFGSPSGPGVTHAYDGFGRALSEGSDMAGSANTLGYGYDAHGNRNYVGGIVYAYDAADRMLSVASGSGVMARFDYDPAGRPLSTTSLWSTTATASVSYGYDPLGRLQALTQGLAGTAADQALTFGYNAASQVVTREATNDAYASNSAANGTRGYSVNGLNQYTQAAGATLQYDLNGNLMSDGSTAYVYDSENRLVSASGARNATLSYDPLGRLWQVAAPSGTTRFFYDGDRLMSETDGAGTTLRAYAHGPGADTPVVWWELTGVPAFRRFLHADHQGSIVAVSDASNGNPLAINAYDPWGVPNAANLGRFGYTGQAWIAELGLYYYKARFYSPALGRFLQTDPVGYDGGINLYGYVGNDPINALDPSGASRVCTQVTGSLNQACVGVDGNGDGNWRDKDLTSAQVSSMGNAFHDFIVQNRGANLSNDGASVSTEGKVTDEQANYVRAVSQFVGHTLGGWPRNSEIVVTSRLGSDVAGSTESFNWGDGLYYTHRINPTFMDHSSNPSSLARTELHEFGHREGFGGRVTAVNDALHQGIDLWARRWLIKKGLGGGGCPAIGGGLWGLIPPSYPGC